MNVHKLNLNDIHGFGRKKPLLNFIFLMGALGIGGIPLWNGYISKTLIHESIVEYIALLQEGELAAGIFSIGTMRVIEWTFLISGGLTVAYMTKLYIALFVEKNQDSAVQEKYDALQGKYMNKTSAAALLISSLVLPAMGFMPGQVMNRLADMGQDFMQVCEEIPAVAYFNFENLKGGMISIGIGALIYLVIVRMLLMKKDENGVKAYVNRWPKWLDLEELVYRPVLLSLLPFVFGVLCRILDRLMDGIVVLLRKTIYRDSPLPHEREEGTYLTHIVGVIANVISRLWNRLFRRKNAKNTDYEHKLALMHDEWAEDSTIISRGLSFGLLLFCTGLTLTVVYLLVTH